MKRPLIPVALSLILGILLGHFSIPLPALFGASALVALLFLFWARARLALLCVLLVLTGWTDFACRTTILSPHDLRALFPNRDASVTVRGKLRATPVHRLHRDIKRNQNYWTTTAEIETSQVCEDGRDPQPAFGVITVTTDGNLPDSFFGGQTVEIAGLLRPPPGPLAEGLFDYRAYLEHQGIYYAMRLKSPADWKIIDSPASPPLADRFCAWAKGALARGLPVEDESLQLEWALTLGWKAALTDEIAEPFLKASTYVDFLNLAPPRTRMTDTGSSPVLIKDYCSPRCAFSSGQ